MVVNQLRSGSYIVIHIEKFANIEKILVQLLVLIFTEFNYVIETRI